MHIKRKITHVEEISFKNVKCIYLKIILIYDWNEKIKSENANGHYDLELGVNLHDLVSSDVCVSVCFKVCE